MLGIKTSLYSLITYGLLAITLNEDQCKSVFAPVRDKVLPKLLVSRTTPAALVHGLIDYGGMGIKELYTMQGIAHVKALLEEGSKQTATGKLMRTLIEYHCWKAVVPGIFLILHTKQ